EVEIDLPDRPRRLRSTEMDDGHAVAIAPVEGERDFTLRFDGYSRHAPPIRATVRALGPRGTLRDDGTKVHVLLTNGRGAMSRIAVDLGRVTSKYDCLLGANLHPEVPCDRHVLVKRFRAWLNADGFITALDGECSLGVEAGPPARFRFAA